MRARTCNAYVVSTARTIDVNPRSISPCNLQGMRVAYEHDDFAEPCAAICTLQIDIHGRSCEIATVAHRCSCGPLAIRRGGFIHNLLGADGARGHDGEQDCG